ncbi:SETMR methyltransferase, partial [Acromyrmex heyeri]
MAERLKLLVQKQTSLKGQIIGLTNTLDKGRIDNATLKLCIARLTKLYHIYEDYNDELAVLDSRNDNTLYMIVHLLKHKLPRATMDKWRNFISEIIVRYLNVPVIKQSILIGAINAMRTELKGAIQMIIQSLHNDFSKTLTCLIDPITDLISSETFPRVKRLTSLEHKLNADETLKIEYARVFEEYLKLKHMSLINNPEDDGFYMSHHAVIKDSSSTTKVRIVFDVSAKTSNGISLNALMIGPTTYKYVFAADIEKCLALVELGLTFGVLSSPFLAIRTIQNLADDEYYNYPRATEITKAHLYIDDLLNRPHSGRPVTKKVDEILQLVEQDRHVSCQEIANALRINHVTQLDRLQEAIKEKRPELVVFHHDNARPYTSLMTRQKLRELGWEVLMHPPYSPDLAPSDYHLFRSLQNSLDGKILADKRAAENHLKKFFADKPQKFYTDGIMKLPEKWQKVIDNNGQYILD